jgi:M6 family metalloprotease-like protein
LVHPPLRAQQELKICALRVEFQPDNNPLTTGTGQFMSDTSEITPFTIDPPPHGRSYFKDQIIAVDNYYFAASKGKLNISGVVFPLDNESVYVLPHEMGYYSPNTSEDENNFRLAQLFSDAITIADSDPNIVFSNFDLVTIFHAGVGKDIDLGFDDTPQDIPSIYYTPDFLKKALGNDFNGIIVDQGDVVIERAALLPETESQADFEIALTGIFAANVGSHLGMYDLFSPTTQTSGIGSFGVMDAGLFNIFGLLPAMPCAFSRMLMGWDTPVMLTEPINNIEIARYEGASSSAVTMYQVPINSQEYYLLEYRGERQYNIDSAFVVISEGRDVLPTYLEVLKTYLPDRIHVSDSTGVLLHVDSYDWGLPGSGILIWHIDESIISQQGRSNAINEDRENRAVDLEEADGSQDIGYTYSIVEPGYQSELGTWLDFWFSQNLAPLYNNEFSVQSSPNTRSNRNYANSHIVLNNFSNNNKSTMTFNYDRSFYNAGFPITINTDQELSYYYSNPKLTTVPIAVASTMFTSDDKGRIFAVSGDGKGTNCKLPNFRHQNYPNLRSWISVMTMKQIS